MSSSGHLKNLVLGRLPFLLFLLSLIPVPLVSGIIPIVQYDKQHLHIRVCPKQVFVCGQYSYCNPFPFPVSQGFAFVSDPKQGRPEDLSISLMDNDQESVAITNFAGYRSYTIKFLPFQKRLVQVSYHQQCPDNEVIFPVTAARSWGRPLALGTYVLHEDGTEIENSNYAMKRQGKSLVFERTNFRPGNDWKFKWTCGGS